MKNNYHHVLFFYILGWCRRGVDDDYYDDYSYDDYLYDDYLYDDNDNYNSDPYESNSTNDTFDDDEENNDCKDFEDWHHMEVYINNTNKTRNCDEAFDHFARENEFGSNAFCHNFADNRTNIFADVACCKDTLFTNI